MTIESTAESTVPSGTARFVDIAELVGRKFPAKAGGVAVAATTDLRRDLGLDSIELIALYMEIEAVSGIDVFAAPGAEIPPSTVGGLEAWVRSIADGGGRR